MGFCAVTQASILDRLRSNGLEFKADNLNIV